MTMTLSVSSGLPPKGNGEPRRRFEQGLTQSEEYLGRLSVPLGAGSERLDHPTKAKADSRTQDSLVGC
jgi:hypothetical protein